MGISFFSSQPEAVLPGDPHAWTPEVVESVLRSLNHRSKADVAYAAEALVTLEGHIQDECRPALVCSVRQVLRSEDGRLPYELVVAKRTHQVLRRWLNG